jgi:hypothetical protein
MPTRKYLNVGFLPNDGKGDTLRDAAEKIEYNFGLLFDDLDVESINSAGNLSEGGISILNSPVTMVLPDATEAGELKKLVHNTFGTCTITGTFQLGTTLTMTTQGACLLVWTGNAWALVSDAGISVT